MQYRKVEAGRGAEWLKGAIRLYGEHPGPLAAMGALIGLIGLLPVLGSVVLTLFYPALLAGLMFAAREAQAGRRIEVVQLFQAFRLPGRLPALVVLALPGILAGLLSIWLIVDLFGLETLAQLASGATSPDKVQPAEGRSLGGVLIKMIAAALVVFALVFFAVPLVMFGGGSPWAAMGASLRACGGNLGALVLYLALLIAVVLVLSIAIGIVGMLLAALGQLGQVLVHLALFAVLLPLTAIGNLLAWQAVFGDAGAPPATREDQAVAEL
ncbi:BPSS1780 family membrane protein [Rehaibacterium terrae]|jgi:uncharacterized membrane protein|uniref:Putative membrane protein n=1 Tax=Rehaibacterium terrae TaxID=1341696 RepID=A0A7W7XY57_9GAMM|nr:BPSS1780 family membrane protein [Rehaibacterium terrae]MBB5014150.1 putative membrane protein [Rehaibacterium terrae]